VWRVGRTAASRERRLVWPLALGATMRHGPLVPRVVSCWGTCEGANAPRPRPHPGRVVLWPLVNTGSTARLTALSPDAAVR
jgi:hypothetical protein